MHGEPGEMEPNGPRAVRGQPPDCLAQHTAELLDRQAMVGIVALDRRRFPPQRLAASRRFLAHHAHRLSNGGPVNVAFGVLDGLPVAAALPKLGPNPLLDLFPDRWARHPTHLAYHRSDEDAVPRYQRFVPFLRTDVVLPGRELHTEEYIRSGSLGPLGVTRGGTG